jgi:hypothetical protein
VIKAANYFPWHGASSDQRGRHGWRRAPTVTADVDVVPVAPTQPEGDMIRLPAYVLGVVGLPRHVI